MPRFWNHFHRILVIAVLALIQRQSAEAMDQPTIRYDIQVTLDISNKKLIGRETIRYISGADSALNELYLHFYPNAFSGSNSTLAKDMEIIYRDFTIAHAKRQELGGLDINFLTVDGINGSCEIDDTSVRIKLPRPLAAHDSVLLEIGFVTKIPSLPGRFRTQDGDFSIAQWYPKMAVYDRMGWHHDPYHLIGEFYGDFATYDVSISLPTQVLCWRHGRIYLGRGR